LVRTGGDPLVAVLAVVPAALTAVVPAALTAVAHLAGLVVTAGLAAVLVESVESVEPGSLVVLTWEVPPAALAASPGAGRQASSAVHSMAAQLMVQLPASVPLPMKGRSLGVVAGRGSRDRVIRLRRAR
jgi:hypothetical protein